MASQDEENKSTASGEDGHTREATEKTPAGEDAGTKEKKPGLLSKAWTFTGLDVPTIMLMSKGGIPPIIAIAAYQSDTWSKKYTTLGYLVAIMSLLGMCIMPRAKFIQTMMLNILFVCVGAAIALLELQCVVSARQATTPSAASVGTTTGSSGSTESDGYNASASAVSAVWLFITIFAANVLRAKRPQLQFPVIVYSIFTVVTSCYAPRFPTMTAAESFVKRLLESFLTGFGIAAAVSFFIIPMTSRTIASKQMAGFLGLLKLSLVAHGKYMHSISQSHRPEQDHPAKDVEAGGHHHHHFHLHHDKKADKQKTESALSAEAQAMKKVLFQIGALWGKIDIEIGFAKKEMAYGHLGPEDFSEMVVLLRDILLPVFGMTTFIDIMQSVRERKHPEDSLLQSEDTIEAIRNLEKDEWEEIMAMSHDQFKALNGVMQQGLTHISFVLKLVKKPKTPLKDEEKEGDPPSPGDISFGNHLEEQLHKFYAHRELVMREWCERKGIELPHAFWDDPSQEFWMKDHHGADEALRQKANQQQLYLVLYVEFLTWTIGKNILKMIRFADSKVEDGTMTKKRIIFPGWKRIKKWAKGLLAEDDTEDGIESAEAGTANIWVGDALKTRKDPEHLPPANVIERVTDKLRVIPEFLESAEAAFGFRVAVATMSLGVIAYLHQTEAFFLRQRGVWALIMTAISMSAHAGQGTFGFVCRILGTLIAMIASYLIWYIGDQKTGAVLPLCYIYLCCGFWFLLKNPKFVVVGIISMVTAILVIGYELQVRKIGIALATSNGQPAYPLYELAPYRLAAVSAGIGVAFFWTYVPYPITTSSTLRKDLGATIYLLANYYSCVHTMVQMRLRMGKNFDETKKKSPTARLIKARNKVFSKSFILLNLVRQHSEFTKFEPAFGGKFPKSKYDQLIETLQNIFNYTSMISYSAKTFTTDPSSEESGWVKSFRIFAGDLDITTHDVTSTLSLLSAAITDSRPLPPYMRLPRSISLSEQVENADPEILSIRHVSEPCYAAFAVLQIASRLINEEMRKSLKLVQDLVGEVDFSFHIISTNADTDSHTASSTALGDSDDGSDKGKRD